MAINPPSDIVLDVARAADPAARQAAIDKLAGAGAPARADAQLFANMIDRMQPTAMPGGFRPSLPANSKAAEAYRSFEAFFIQSFIQSMLPKNSEANFGSGTAGEMWRSMSAEHMAKAIADAGGVGIAERLMAQEAATHSAWSRDSSDPTAGFSVASLAQAKPYQDWASYLPYLDPKMAGTLWNRPSVAADAGTEQLLSEAVS
jgi:Rod binding domain-containing protein